MVFITSCCHRQILLLDIMDSPCVKEYKGTWVMSEMDQRYDKNIDKYGYCGDSNL